MTQRKSINSQNVTISGLDDRVHKCVKYLFGRGCSKQPIMRIDIIKFLTDDGQVSKEQVEYIFKKAQDELKRVYGYNLVELKETNGRQYIIVLDQPDNELLSSFTNPLHRRMLLATLTHIFMTGGPVSEDNLWKFLFEADVLKEDDYNGRKEGTKIFTNTFTRQLYLTRTKMGEGAQSKYVFDWGPRAHKELPKMFLLKKVAKALNKEPKYWSEQYKVATQNLPSNEAVIII